MLLVIAGMRRSGSTLSYQISCALCKNEDGPRLVWKLPKGAENSARWHVVKTHRYHPEMLSEIENGKIRVIVTIRDPRDVVTSMMSLSEDISFDMALNKINWEINQYESWLSGTSKLSVFRYEDFYNNLEVLITGISNVIGIKTSNNKIVELSERFSFNNNKIRSQEIVKTESDFMFPGHTQDGIVGKWKVLLENDQVEKIEETIGKKWFEDNNY